MVHLGLPGISPLQNDAFLISRLPRAFLGPSRDRAVSGLGRSRVSLSAGNRRLLISHLGTVRDRERGKLRDPREGGDDVPRAEASD